MALDGGAPASDHSTTPTVGIGPLTSFLLTVNSQADVLLPSQPSDASRTMDATRNPRPNRAPRYCSVGVVQSVSAVRSKPLCIGWMATFEVVDVPLRYRFTKVATLCVWVAGGPQWLWPPVKS